MAADRVFDTTELLESILMELPFRNIVFTATLVSRQWKAVVDNSISLQRATFRAPDGDPTLLVSAVQGDKIPLRPLLKMSSVKAQPLWEDITASCSMGILREDIDTSAIEARPRALQYDHYSDEVGESHNFCWKPEHLDLHSGIRLPFAVRSMYLTQPPVTACKLGTWLTSTVPPVVLYDKSGIRLGFIASTLAEMLRQCERTNEQYQKDWRERLENDEIQISFRVESNGEQQAGEL